MSTANHLVQASSPRRATAKQWAGLVVLMLPVLLVAVDNTVLSFALPSISAALQPSGTELLWIIDIYPLVLAGLLVPMGSLADRLGRRRLLLLGSAGFAATSALAAYAPNAETLIAARTLLGLFGAMLMPSTLSLLRHLFPDREQRRLAVAIWATGWAAGAALGPVVGGTLLEHFWWGSVFLLAVPVLSLLLMLGPVFLPESRDPAPGRIDPASIALSMVAMVPLVYGIKSFAHDGFSGHALTWTGVGFAAGATFIQRQLNRSDPMLDVRLFRTGAFGGAVAVNLLSVFSLVGFLFFSSQHLQLVLGLSPMESSFVLVPGLVAMVIAGLAVVPLVRLVHPSRVVAGGLLLAGTGYATVTVVGHGASAVALMVAFVLVALGIGSAETISNDLVVSTVPAHRAGAASAISETAYEVGAVLGTAVLGSILTASYRSAVDIPRALGDADAAAATETLGGATAVAADLPAGQAEALLTSARAAFDSGVALTSGIGVMFMVFAAVVAILSLRNAV
jgi:DHA2 family multidrug resistance protein-like MFS transporter